MSVCDRKICERPVLWLSMLPLLLVLPQSVYGDSRLAIYRRNSNLRHYGNFFLDATESAVADDLRDFNDSNSFDESDEIDWKDNAVEVTTENVKAHPFELLHRFFAQIKDRKALRKDPKETNTGLDFELTQSLFGSVRDAIIYPGTVWCGGGHAAKSINDVGFFYKTDKCCKAHDYCDESIVAGTEKYGLRNWGLFTRLHCSCDKEFYECLKKANTIISNKIGYTYFTLIGPQCYRKEYPIVGCLKFHRNSNRCDTYIVDERQNQTWQWFDNKIY